MAGTNPTERLCWWTFYRGTLSIAVLTAITLTGCGESKTETVQPPPLSSDLAASNGQSDSDSVPSDPPGGMELPNGDIQAAKTAGSDGANGLEMPSVQNDTQAAAAVKVQYASWPDIERQGTASGKLTVVDVWSTGCLPCIKELPGLAKIHESMGSNVQCISMNIDFDGRKSKPPETYEEDVTKILNSAGVTCTNFICTTASDDVFAATGIATIPAVLVYDQEGTLIKKFTDIGAGAGFTYDKDVIPLITDQLK